MLDAISAAQTAMLQDQLKLQSISQNVSNLQTPGYKRQVLEFQNFNDQLQVNASTATGQVKQSTALLQGTFNQSKIPTHVALSGEGYFEIQSDEGVFYTRRGDFHVNEEGLLCTANGGRLLGKNGAIHVDDNTFTINPNGAIFVDNQLIDYLNIVQFPTEAVLTNQGEGLFLSDEAPLTANATTHVLQGYLEQSNVKSIDEMINMVKTSRHYEASQHIMRAADQMAYTAIHSLGEGNV